MGREVVSRSRFASAMRASAICLCTDDDRHSLNARSTSVREKPTWRNTSDAEMPRRTFSRMNASASANHAGACGYVFVEARSTIPRGGTTILGGLVVVLRSDSMSASVSAADFPIVAASGSTLESRGAENMQ